MLQIEFSNVQTNVLNLKSVVLPSSNKRDTITIDATISKILL